MATQKKGKLNSLDHSLPEGLLVDAAWLGRNGYSTALRSQYVAAGWLEQPARGVYRRPRGELGWELVVISLQALMDKRVAIGGRTALELQGFTHYLSRDIREIHLYGDALPSWLEKLQLSVRFVAHRARRLFTETPQQGFGVGLSPSTISGAHLGNSAFSEQAFNNLPVREINAELDAESLALRPYGQWNWPLILSTPERALLELLDEVPKRESFEQADKFMEGLTNLSPRRLRTLLTDCQSVKVKRLFFFFADRHKHAWLKLLDKTAVDFGVGKRMLIKGGKLNRAYQITVPEEMNAVS
ncbi:MAG: type IV toxin-antitoxin system AbiEi family antitoxin [Alphaproteobacteria bacterium]|nr:type IV toxin-antitoxin system AbiEi family antitoxin [Alphaproteobacteria bacterium]